MRRPPPARRRPRTALRVTRSQVETAVWTMVHPTTGRRVTLVGTMHIGDRAYFEGLSGVLAGLARAGTEVHIEGIHRRAGDRLSDWEADRLAEAEHWGDLEAAGAAVALLSLESQGAKLRLPGGARNIDLSHAELLRGVGWDNYRRLFAPAPVDADAPPLGRLGRAALRFELRHSRLLERLRWLRRRNRRVNRVVIRQRNALAFAAGAAALTRGDVALVWGTDHLPGLAKRFRAEGYQGCRQEWFAACTI